MRLLLLIPLLLILLIPLLLLPLLPLPLLILPLRLINLLIVALSLLRPLLFGLLVILLGILECAVLEQALDPSDGFAQELDLLGFGGGEGDVGLHLDLQVDDVEDGGRNLIFKSFFLGRRQVVLDEGA